MNTILTQRRQRGPVEFAPLAARTLAEQVAERLVDAIAERRLNPGDHLVETELSDSLQVSRVPVREALQTLLSQGVVVPGARRGLLVGPFDAPWARQLRVARIALERQAAPLAAARIRDNPALAGQIEASIAAIADSREDWRSVNKADIAFHTAVFAIADSPLLSSLWRAIARHVLILFSFETEAALSPDFDSVLDEHRRYYDLLLHDPDDQLIAEIGRHITASRRFTFSPTAASGELP